MSIHVNEFMSTIMPTPIKVGVHMYTMHANCGTLSSLYNVLYYRFVLKQTYFFIW